ncbi:Phage tail fibre repeat-containing protein [Paenibacillus sp. ov031]|uniref:tail fiber protein n=1 Tax=Paenibacillus sp. ov031 TaxID=1761879 RepID=UPI0009186937|nr:phage tail protein [Paenibacillus sp. ov031]SHN74610.1 Phage tail fibre repeat-containing protein [Paenibacillus sp. ov031]
MPQETDRLKLPLPLGNENVTRESINGIFEKIDAGVATQADLDTLREAVSQMDIPDASLTQKGKVQLSSKTDGTSETVAATEKAVRDASVTAETNAKNASLPRSGGSIVSDAGVLHLVGSTHVYQGFLPEGQDSGRKGYIGFGTPGGKDFTIANEYGGELLFRDKNGVTALSDLKQSVSNGKASIAAAITGKGVPTAADAQFATIASNVEKIQQGRYQNLNITNNLNDFVIGASHDGTKWSSFAKFSAGTKLITMNTGTISFGNLYTPVRHEQYAASMNLYLVDINGNRLALVGIAGGSINNDNYNWYNFEIGSTLTSLFVDSTKKSVGLSGSTNYVSYNNRNTYSTRNKPYATINVPASFDFNGELELALYITKSNITESSWAGGTGTGVHYYASNTNIVSL